MFSPKKHKISKKDLKKSIVNTNDRLKAINSKLELDIEARKQKFKSMVSDYDAYKKALEDTKEMQVFANNELEGTQFEIAEAQSTVKKALSKVASLSEEAVFMEKRNQELEGKEKELSKVVALLEKRKEELVILTADIKQIREEAATGQKSLELLAVELNEMETGVESYISRKSAAESEFNAFKGKITREKGLALGEVKEIEAHNAQIKLDNGKEMARLDHAIADRMSELKDYEELVFRKKYEFSTVQSKISIVEAKVNEVEERIEYAIKREQEKVVKIKGDFKNWKVEALDEVARLKIKKKIENIDRAGLKDVLNG